MQMKNIVIVFLLLGLYSCVEPTQTQETKMPNIELSTKTKEDTVMSTTESLKLTYKERIAPSNKENLNAVDSVLIEMLTKIPEINNYSKRLDSISKGKSRLVYKTVEAPSADSPYYFIKVIEKSPSDQKVKFQFYVNPTDFAIKIYDPTEDILMDLDFWQKTNHGN